MSDRIPATNIRLKRAYDPPAKGDGKRILVDRLWPRGVKKETAALDQWVKEIAPSDGLRQWFNHEPARWAEFQRRYADELKEHRDLIGSLRQLARKGPVTLVYAARDTEHNDAVVLRQVLLGHMPAADRVSRT